MASMLSLVGMASLSLYHGENGMAVIANVQHREFFNQLGRDHFEVFPIMKALSN